MKGNQFSDQAHCYDDLNNASSNAGESKGGMQYDNDTKYGGGGSKGISGSTTTTINASIAGRGKAGASESY